MGFVVLHGCVEVVQNVSILLIFLDYEEKSLILAIFTPRIFASAREKVTILPCLLNNYSSIPKAEWAIDSEAMGARGIIV